METKTRNNWKQNPNKLFCIGPTILSYELWKQSYELWKLKIQTPPKISQFIFLPLYLTKHTLKKFSFLFFTKVFHLPCFTSK